MLRPIPSSKVFYCVKDGTFSNKFPSTQQAMIDPDGLLAIGGTLSTTNLLNAYKNGIFPWYTEGEPILWWSPKTRPIIEPGKIKISKSLYKTIKKNNFRISYDHCFERVMDGCATTGVRVDNSWITEEIRSAYIELHRLGYAHSVECWQDDLLCGGLYGVSLGTIFYGESMFSIKSDASKVALVSLCQKLINWGYEIIDCQVTSRHLQSLGAKVITRDQFEEILIKNLEKKPAPNAWHATLLGR